MARNGSKPTFVVPRVRVRSTAPIEINIEMFEVQFWIYIQTINKISLSVRTTIYSTFSIPEISTIGGHRKPYKNSKNNNVICGAINE